MVSLPPPSPPLALATPLMEGGVWGRVAWREIKLLRLFPGLGLEERGFSGRCKWEELDHPLECLGNGNFGILQRSEGH